MQSNLPLALNYIRNDEGEELNISANEPGGASRWGISIATLSDYRAKQGLPPATIDDLKALTPPDVDAFYSAVFAEPLRFDDLPSGVDYRLLDVAVNLGLTGGANLMQLTLGLYPLTGKMDDGTLKIITSGESARSVILISALSAAWIAVKHTSPNWGPSSITKSGYGKGWSVRNNCAVLRALAMLNAQ